MIFWNYAHQNILFLFTGGFGGLNALAILFAIKFKLLVVASIIAFSVYYYSKWIAVKKCRGHHDYREGGIYPAESS